MQTKVGNYILPIERGFKFFLIDNFKTILYLFSILLINIILIGFYEIFSNFSLIGFWLLIGFLGLCIYLIIIYSRIRQSFGLLELKLKEKEKESEMHASQFAEIISKLELEIKTTKESAIKSKQEDEIIAKHKANTIARLKAEIKNIHSVLNKSGMVSNVDTVFRNLHHKLIEGCKEGDQKAQFQIYKLFYKSMYRTSLRIVNDPMEAEDIMQESFLEAFQNIDAFPENISLGTWLKRIVVNHSLDVMNKRKIVFEDIDAHVDLIDESEDETARDIEIDGRVEEVQEAIEILTDNYRVILSLYLFEGYDPDEIANILSIKRSTARSQISKAKKKLLIELKRNKDLKSKKEIEGNKELKGNSELKELDELGEDITNIKRILLKRDENEKLIEKNLTKYKRS